MKTKLDTGWAYFRTSCETRSEQDFRNLLTDDVHLFNQTNNEKVEVRDGIDAVVDAFSQYIFKNTKKNRTISVGFAAGKTGMTAFINVKQSKKMEDGSYVRFHFQETTDLTFRKVDGVYKITSITMKVKREPA